MKKHKTIRLSLHIWQIQNSMLYLVVTVCLGWGTAAGENREILLNSCDRCNLDDTYGVSSNISYSVLATDSAETDCQWECPFLVHSSSSDGWLCVFQDGLMSQFNDSNARLSISESHDPKPFAQLEYFPNGWSKREECRKTSYINIFFKRKNPKMEVDFRKLRINLQVVPISSPLRKVYLVKAFCEAATTYKLLNSKVSLYNKPPENEIVSYDHTFPDLCGIPFQMVEIEEATNRSICIIYIPSDNVNCNSNWELSLSKNEYSIRDDDMVYSLRCGELQAQKIHAWCAPPTLTSVTVVVKRTEKQPVSAENPEMFRFIIRDYSKGNISLLEETLNEAKEPQGQKNDYQEASASPVLAIVLCVIGVVIVILVLAYIGYKKWRPYLPVRNGNVTRADV